MDKQHPSRLRFNFGFLIEARLGTSRTIELDYPTIDVEDLRLAPLKGTLEVTRTSEGVYLAGTLNTVITVECVRCLNDAYVPLTVTLGELLYYPPWEAPPGELYIGEDGYIDLAPLVRELALLEVPIQPTCRPDCQGLCQECGQNLNEGDCGCEDEELDPRLAMLKELLDKE
ncbi:MAG: DUF177 domain-containing protein [Ardenticatenaceae bacterium]|nr:DUF177 domain-containing protein [Ardenticatenaceae bacterium]